MELHQIRHFLAVAEAGGFTKGAEQIAVTQPALSASVAKLEAELGVRLFDRSRQRVMLTAAGQRLLEASKDVMQIFKSVKSELEDLDGARLRLAVVRTAPTAYLANLIPAFAEAHPNITLQVTEGIETDICRHLDQKQCHLGLTVLHSPDHKFVSRLLFEDDFVLLVNRRHPFARRPSISLRELNGERYVLRTSCSVHNEAKRALAKRDIHPQIVYRTDQDDRVVSLISEGVGVSLRPRFFQSSKVAAVTVSDLDLKYRLGLRWVPTRNTDAIQQFVTFALGRDWRTAGAATIERNRPRLVAKRMLAAS
jgi:DNA-binding transcriptional LysR family regulator